MNRIHKRLLRLFSSAKELTLEPGTRAVVFSDFHMGDGGGRDDFAHNGELIQTMLERYYLPEGFLVILNGDIEELQRFYPASIRKAWPDIYRIFDRLRKGNRLVRLFGNHDIELRFHRGTPDAAEALRLIWKGHVLLVFHGHQASWFFTHLNRLVSLLLRLIANPLGIKNYAVAFNSRKKYRIEKRIYEFSKSEKIASLVGHTHRALFESLSEKDRVKFQMEALCRKYASAGDDERPGLKKKIISLKREFHRLRFRKMTSYEGSLYHRGPLVPCLFNSGSAIGKRGMTSLEIDCGIIRLVYWYDQRIPQEILEHNGFISESFGKGDLRRVILNEEPLDYLFTRIALLA